MCQDDYISRLVCCFSIHNLLRFITFKCRFIVRVIGIHPSLLSNDQSLNGHNIQIVYHEAVRTSMVREKRLTGRILYIKWTI